MYWNEIKNIPSLTLEEERTLIPKAKKGDKKAQQRIVESMLKYVISIAKKYYMCCHRIEFEDLVGYGNLAIYNAIKSYKPKVKFITYAHRWIKQTMLRALQKHNHTIRPPHILQKVYAKAYKLNITDYKKLAKKLKISRKTAKRALNMYHICSIENLLNSIPYNIDKKHIEDCDYVDYLLSRLKKRHRDILIYRYGLYSKSPHTLQELANKYKISRERIRQIEEDAIRCIRRRFL